MQGAHIFAPLTASGHAFLAPSSGPRWAKCALSASLEAAYPEKEPSPESLEGTCCHWVIESFVRGTQVSLDAIGPNGVAVTFEMLQSVPLVIRTFEKYLGPRWRELVHIERKVHIHAVHPTHCGGTPDYFAFFQLPNGRFLLFVLDFKFGRRVVEVYRNEQLVAYYAGIVADFLKANGQDADQHVDVIFVVVQPRAPHRLGSVREWRCVGSDLRADINILRAQGELALSPNPPARPTLDGCRDCRGRHVCETLQKHAFHGASMAEQSTPYELSPHALGLELQALTEAAGKMQARITGLAAQAEALLLSGKGVPFWKRESTGGKLAWTITNAQVIEYGKMLGANLAKPPEPITPTQAIEAGVGEAMIVGVVAERKPGAMKLVPDDGCEAARIFG